MANVEELRKRIDDSGISKTRIAFWLGISRPTLLSKLRGDRPFDVVQAAKLCEVLHIDDPAERDAIFFKTR